MPNENPRVSGQAFERLVHERLARAIPFSVLPNVALFRPDQFRAEEPEVAVGRINSRAYEIDNVFHYRSNESDNIVIVEAKAPPIRVERNKWMYTRSDGRPRDACDQLTSHAKTLLQYLHPIGRHAELKVEAFVVTSSCQPAGIHTKQVTQEIKLHLSTLEDLVDRIASIRRDAADERSNVQLLRVAQSEFMTLLRLGIPLKSLGHPELRHAIHYVARCRRNIDHELYRSFTPSTGRWAINGTAGMGKSVLLAYATAVFSCNRRLSFRSSDVRLDDFSTRAKEIGLQDLSRRNICVFAMKPKQRDVLEREYLRLFREFSIAAGREELHFIKPHFDVWKDERPIPEECSVLVIDESHDLSDNGQETVRSWFNRSANNYLMLACDRHQKIRLADGSSSLIEGLSFSGHAKKLARNYRNPFAINAAALGLMYRWFADEGVKIIPTEKQFQDLLGFEIAAKRKGMAWRISMKDDSHPGNLWAHCVSSFPSCAAAYAHLAQQNLSNSDLLWIRFSEEDPDFNYEQLNQFTYHNFHGPESAALVDKYVKGQEVPIVVIEGFPDAIEAADRDVNPDAMMDGEKAMWSFRRQVYICASRATAFLYFVFNVPETEPAKRFGRELNRLLRSLASGGDTRLSGSKAWRFDVREGLVRRRPSIFDDMEEAGALGGEASVATAASKRHRFSRSRRDRRLSGPDTGIIVPSVGDRNERSPQEESFLDKTHSKVFQSLPSVGSTDGPRRSVRLRFPIVVRDLARGLGKSIPSVVSELNSIGLQVNNRTVLANDHIEAINRKLGINIEAYR